MKRFSLYALLACLLALLICLGACAPGEEPPVEQPPAEQPPEEEPPVEQPPEEKTVFQITPETVVIRSDTSREYVEAAQQLILRLEEILGYRLTFRTDYDGPFDSEIIVGESTRVAADEFMNSLTSMDHGYAVLSSGAVVVSGGCGESSLAAVELFIQDMFREDIPASEATLSVGNGQTVKYDYPVKTLTFGGKPVTDFTIRYSAGSQYQEAAEKLATLIEDLTGVALPVQKESAAVSTPESILLKKDTSMGDIMTAYESEGSSFIIRGLGDRMTLAVDNFLLATLGKDPKGEIHVAKTEGVVKQLALTETQYYDLKYQETTDTVEVCPGVVRYTRHYIDRNGKPVVAYVIECAPGSVKPVLGTTNGDYKITYQQSILEQIKFEEADHGTDICAAVNGCFYSWTDDGFRASGLLVKDGQVINNNDPTVVQAFGVKKDGSYYFGTPGNGDVKYEDLEFCVSGAFLLLKDGAPYDMGLSWPDQAIVTTRHPRTAVGAKEDGTLFFVVVDGRQADHSNGATLPDLALMLQELGCSDGVNLDGGGSSISYTKDYETGEYIVWNSPSDGKPREILCCTLLARNPEYKEEK